MTNFEALRNILNKMEFENTDEALEFVNAIEEELTDAEDEVKSLKEEIISKGSEISDLEDKLEEKVEFNFETIDCGIGIIEYVQPDNLKLKILMEEFKEKHERKAMFSQELF